MARATVPGQLHRETLHGNDVLHFPWLWPGILACEPALISRFLLLEKTSMKQSALFARSLIAISATALIAQSSIVHAEMIGADAALSAQSQAEQDRAKVQDFIARANVKERLQAMGVSGLVASDRVASLTEQEAHALAQRIDSMPAGGALSNTDLILVLLIALLVALLV
jgi:hypothetical protein